MALTTAKTASAPFLGTRLRFVPAALGEMIAGKTIVVRIPAGRHPAALHCRRVGPPKGFPSSVMRYEFSRNFPCIKKIYLLHGLNGLMIRRTKAHRRPNIMSFPQILGLSGNVTRPSRTAALVGAAVDRLAEATGGQGGVLEIVDAAPHVLSALTRASLSAEGEAILRRVEAADILVVGSPVYRASYTGALKHLFDLVDFNALAGKPVVLAATGGSQLHGLVTDHQLRPLLSFFRALTLPTTLYAVETDFTDYRLTSPAIAARIERAVGEVAALRSHETVQPPRLVALDRGTNRSRIQR